MIDLRGPAPKVRTGRSGEAAHRGRDAGRRERSADQLELVVPSPGQLPRHVRHDPVLADRTVHCVPEDRSTATEPDDERGRGQLGRTGTLDAHVANTENPVTAGL